MLTYYLSLVDSPEEKSTVEEIYHEYKNLILFLALSKLQDQNLAEEALHDVMLVVIDHVKKLQGRDENAVKSFIYLVTRNVCVDTLRKEL
ncbi:MAG: sigma-70 family RNA polymerase sigma factor, partial [Clostridia bacterium]|nr:sigma-70 family RNA polymerase sigma factor [Clostridia bacterium]